MENNENDREGGLEFLIWIIPIVMVLIALLPMPYDYYGIMRFVVCGCSAFLAYAEFDSQPGKVFGTMFVALAFLYNPFFTVHLTRETWSVINVITAVIFLVNMISRGSSKDVT